MALRGLTDIRLNGMTLSTGLQSAGAVLAGIVVSILLTLGSDAALRAAGIFPALGGQPMSDRLFLLAAFYRTVYGILGSYLIARLAPNRPMGHALASGVLGVLVSGAGAIATWNQPGLGPHWYPLALVVTALPCAWVGAKLNEAH
jgi:hypothetical protein